MEIWRIMSFLHKERMIQDFLVTLSLSPPKKLIFGSWWCWYNPLLQDSEKMPPVRDPAIRKSGWMQQPTNMSEAFSSCTPGFRLRQNLKFGHKEHVSTKRGVNTEWNLLWMDPNMEIKRPCLEFTWAKFEASRIINYSHESNDEWTIQHLPLQNWTPAIESKRHNKSSSWCRSQFLVQFRFWTPLLYKFCFLLILFWLERRAMTKRRRTLESGHLNFGCHHNIKLPFARPSTSGSSAWRTSSSFRSSTVELMLMMEVRWWRMSLKRGW